MKRKNPIVSYSADEVVKQRQRGNDLTDWQRVEQLTEAELEAAIADDADADTGPINLMREAINQFLAREEEALRRQQETLESWEHYQTSGEHVSHSAMTAWLETWGTEKEVPCPTLGN